MPMDPDALPQPGRDGHPDEWLAFAEEAQEDGRATAYQAGLLRIFALGAAVEFLPVRARAAFHLAAAAAADGDGAAMHAALREATGALRTRDKVDRLRDKLDRLRAVAGLD